MDSKEYSDVLFQGKTYKSTDELAAIVGPKGDKEVVQDAIKRMFELQKDYQLKMGNGVMPRLDGKLVSDFSLGLYTELGEVLQEYKGWKSWKNSDCYTNNQEALKEELGDCVHFLINLFLALGLDFEDFVAAYGVAHTKNLKRINRDCQDCTHSPKNGKKCCYRGTGKCRNMSMFEKVGGNI